MKTLTVNEIPKRNRQVRSGYAENLKNAENGVITAFQELTFAEVTGFKHQAKKNGFKVTAQKTGEATVMNAQGVEAKIPTYTVYLDKRQPQETVSAI
jgi:hypothetical protein